ncbi:pyridoxamine 5'-phosphate oxidase family protein [Actinoplanes sp. NPDC051494]|uniref:pyridoxamine 5'-phosphate oxidase family protein n=1 Tax=Actinoplanes sp. NPDC051494 TaxID=3363907 RepID=UPI0037B30A06
MASWSEFATAEPELASAIRALLQQYGPGMGYLATVRPDGGPRVHPVSPVITDQGLYCFVVESAKRRDLERDGRFALHSYPPEESDDEAYLTGHARPVTDQPTITHLSDTLRASPAVDWRLFELTIETAMLRRHGPAGALPLAMSLRFPPITLTWHAPTPSTSPTPRPATSTTTVSLVTPTRPRNTAPLLQAPTTKPATPTGPHAEQPANTPRFATTRT